LHSLPLDGFHLGQEPTQFIGSYDDIDHGRFPIGELFRLGRGTQHIAGLAIKRAFSSAMMFSCRHSLCSVIVAR
jgi:hypothetical protein